MVVFFFTVGVGWAVRVNEDERATCEAGEQCYAPPSTALLKLVVWAEPADQ